MYICIELKACKLSNVKTINSLCQAVNNKGKIKSRLYNKFHILLLYSSIPTVCVSGEFSIQNATGQLKIQRWIIYIYHSHYSNRIENTLIWIYFRYTAWLSSILIWLTGTITAANSRVRMVCAVILNSPIYCSFQCLALSRDFGSFITSIPKTIWTP